ncbi:penicillin-binding protein 1C [Radicibacter daui]|uniref:penicillin-binding protein 1C n=1 Tax=Radicibacter daui TaxID=3064829 RepID=UPI004046ACC7
MPGDLQPERAIAASGRKSGRWLAYGGGALLAVFALWRIADSAFPPDLQRYQDRSVEVVDRQGEPLRNFLSRDDKRRYLTKAGDVDPLYLQTLLAFEDKRFWQHPGVDALAALRAAGQLAAHGHVVSGASTLAMQAARLLEPRPRTLPSKLIEMARALQLEAILGREQTLSLYLSLAPFGGNLEGVRAASLTWFGKEPGRLTAAEAALLVAVPQSPERLRPDRFPEAARAARNRVIERAFAAGVLDAQSRNEALAAPLRLTPAPEPFLAPHLAEALVAKAGSSTTRIATTLDATLQRRAEAVLAAATDRLPQGAGLAALVVDAGSANILASIGSGDYFNRARLGMVDMTGALRSPGSALKPFIYGLAFDHAFLRPDSVIDDRALDFGGYAPRNFDGGFHGQVTAAEALRRSLNVPAVAVLDRLGPGRFDAALTRVGVDLAFPLGAEAASLPIALGGAGISLADLTRLYVSLGHQGKAPLALRAVQDAPPARFLPLMAPDAASDVLTILHSLPPPLGRADALALPGGRPVAYKTGTSYGYRDAWAVGLWNGYVVGVWVGRPDGRPCAYCTGYGAAAPLLFDLVDMLPRRPGRDADVGAGSVAVRRPQLAAPSAVRTLGIAFPPDGGRLALPAGRSRLPLEASGGRLPIRWLVNGHPLAGSGAGRQILWQPEGGGFQRIEAIDATGAAAAVDVFVEAGG